MVKLTIDNRLIQVENGTTILQAARMNGISIPTLCYHEAVEPYAACRLCVVELASARGKLVAACAQSCEEGMEILTNSLRVQSSRRITAELLMASGAHLPVVQDLAHEMGVEHVRYSLPANDCILCGLCVRACDELVGAHAISLVGRGLQKKFAPPFEIASAACIGCATCVLICPTGVIKLVDVTPQSHPAHATREPAAFAASKACRPSLPMWMRY
ncbi:MAG: (2Fe-2S)-binding protein [Chloroflexi bacterium]|nr:(2Fe-2S)-binding protein [Chloroflexota bacterium]